MAEPGWKEALAQGRPLEPHFELSPELVNRMGIHKDDAESVFLTLTKNRRKTWGNLLDLKTEAKAIEVAGDDVSGETLWIFIEGQRELSKKRVPLAAKPKSAEEVLRDELAGLNWPEHLEAFSPRTLDTESFRNREAAVRVAQAGILGNFLRPTEPDLLLTELTKVRAANEFAIHEFEYHIDASDNLSLENPSSIDFKVLDGMGMIVLIGTSGAGRTALTLRRALDRPTILLACTPQSAGGMGSSDITEILEKAESLKNSGDLSIHQISDYIMNKVNKILYARGRLYAECKRRYPGFTNLHWIMLQLYGSNICGENWWCPNYFHHPSEATSPADLLSEARIEEVVLDDAQIADTVLTGTFPSSNRITKRSILSPIAQALKSSALKVTICGTALSSASVVPAVGSSIKFGVRVGVVAVATFLDPHQVKEYLEKSGVSDLDKLDQDALELFQGRPRHAEYLARALILSENPSSATASPESTKDVAAIVEELKETFRLIYRSNLQRTRGMGVELLGETSQSAKDLYCRIAIAAARYRLGYPGILETGFQTAMLHGVCALRELEEDASGYGSQSSRRSVAKRARLVRPVVAEPLLLNAFSEDVLRTFENAFLEAHNHSMSGSSSKTSSQ